MDSLTRDSVRYDRNPSSLPITTPAGRINLIGHPTVNSDSTEPVQPVIDITRSRTVFLTTSRLSEEEQGITIMAIKTTQTSNNETSLPERTIVSIVVSPGIV